MNKALFCITTNIYVFMYIFRELDGERVLYKQTKRGGNGQKYIVFGAVFFCSPSPVPRPRLYLFIFKEAFPGGAPFALPNPDRNDRRRQTTYIERAV